MSLETFQILDNELFDKSSMKRDFLKVYHKQEAQLNQSDQNFEIILGENNNYHQIGNSHLKFELTVQV